MKRNLTTSQKIHFAEASNEIESEFALHVFYHSTEVRPDSPFTSVKWSKRSSEVTSSHGFGGLVGYDYAVLGWTKGMTDFAGLLYEKCAERYPEIRKLDEKNPEDYYNLGTGCVMHTLASPVIEVAEDGMSAKTSFYTPGMVWATLTFTGKQRGGWMWERYGQDLVFEEGEWRVLNNQVMLDWQTDIDFGNIGRDSYKEMKETGWIWNGMMPGPDTYKELPGPANMDYWPVIIPQRTVLWPEPYKTYDETWHYIPEAGDGIGEYWIEDLPNIGRPEKAPPFV